jgi:Mg2+ and Co2+ transporter CorA
MVEATDIEKKSLEAHVELCAERYNAVERRLDTVDEKISSMSKMIKEMHEMMYSVVNKRNDQIINWGIGIIGVLVASLTWVVTHYVIQ